MLSVGLDSDVIQTIDKLICQNRPFLIDHRMMDQILPREIEIYPNELQDSLADMLAYGSLNDLLYRNTDLNQES
jgi:hypothetical protein